MFKTVKLWIQHWQDRTPHIVKFDSVDGEMCEYAIRRYNLNASEYQYFDLVSYKVAGVVNHWRPIINKYIADTKTSDKAVIKAVFEEISQKKEPAGELGTRIEIEK